MAPVELAGAAAIVTGGASGIGAAVVDLLHEAGARVAVLDLRAGDGAGDLAVPCDVADEEQVVGAVARTAETFGGLDVAVLAAAVGGAAPVLRMTAEEWDRVQAVNLRGAFLSLRESARAMVASRRRGSIVAVTSVSGFLADRLMAHYCASKAGLAQLVRVAARELGPEGIRVNAVAPGTTDTPMFARTDALPGYREKIAARSALGAVGDPRQVAEAIVALARLDWVTGQVVAADGGVSLFSPIDAQESMGR